MVLVLQLTCNLYNFIFRYIPEESDAMDTNIPQQAPEVLRKPDSAAPAASNTTTYFPKEGYITFATANVDAILGI